VKRWTPLVAAAALALPLAPAGAAIDRPTGTSGATLVPALYKNCKALNKRYRHGVGRARARDKTSSPYSEPVTTFKRSTRLYNVAMSYNNGLDRDKDGIACEKA